MNLTSSLLWVSMFALFLAPLSRADVCQKDGDRLRIKMSVRPDKKFQFQACSEGDSNCVWIGPQGKGFTYGELVKKRNELDTIIVRNKAVDTTGGLLTVLLLPLGGVGEAGEAAKASNEARAIAREAKKNIKTLASNLLNTAPKCSYVESVSDHRARLAVLLKEIDDAKLKAAEVAQHKIEEARDAKVVPASATAAVDKKRIKSQGETPAH